MISVYRFFKNKMFISDQYNYEYKILEKLTTNILKKKIFKYLNI